jgi:hypothetical protein
MTPTSARPAAGGSTGATTRPPPEPLPEPILADTPPARARSAGPDTLRRNTLHTEDRGTRTLYPRESALFSLGLLGLAIAFIISTATQVNMMIQAYTLPSVKITTEECTPPCKYPSFSIVVCPHYALNAPIEMVGEGCRLKPYVPHVPPVYVLVHTALMWWPVHVCDGALWSALLGPHLRGRSVIRIYIQCAA